MPFDIGHTYSALYKENRPPRLPRADKEHPMARPKTSVRRSSAPVRSVVPLRSSGPRPAMFRDLVMLLYATTGRLQRLKRLVASVVGLNSAEYSIVAALYRLGPNSGIRVRDIGNYLHMAPENVTTVVGKLVR